MDPELHLASQKVIAQGALTNSKRPESYVKGIYPTHVTRGSGCYLFDTKGKKYIDFIGGLGANLLGYGNYEVAFAVMQRLNHGITLSFATPDEIRFGEELKEYFPFIDAIKCLKSGTEACNAAIRIARNKTQRMLVLSKGYHGWGDEFISLSPPAAGIPKHEQIREFTAIDQITPEVAAVIVEPVECIYDEARRKWLKSLRDRCTLTGTYLIFDEIITGFRFDKHSVAKASGVYPDLICLGKAIAGGLPLSIVGGRYEAMNEMNYFVSSTFAGETASIAAARYILKALRTPKYDISRLWQEGQKWIEWFNGLYPQKIRLEAYPSRGRFVGDELTIALFFQEACLAGMLFGPSWFFTFAHLEIDKSYQQTIKEILCRIQKGEVALKGQLPQKAFAQRMRENR